MTSSEVLERLIRNYDRGKSYLEGSDLKYVTDLLNNDIKVAINDIIKVYNKLLEVAPRGCDEMLDAFYQAMDNVLEGVK